MTSDACSKVECWRTIQSWNLQYSMLEQNQPAFYSSNYRIQAANVSNTFLLSSFELSANTVITITYSLPAMEEFALLQNNELFFTCMGYVSEQPRIPFQQGSFGLSSVQIWAKTDQNWLSYDIFRVPSFTAISSINIYPNTLLLANWSFYFPVFI